MIDDTEEPEQRIQSTSPTRTVNGKAKRIKLAMEANSP